MGIRSVKTCDARRRRLRPMRAAAVLLALILAGAAAAVRAASVLGGLYVVTDPPEAAIYVNGELKGVSPCGIADVPAGDAEVQALKQGFEAAATIAEVRGGETTQVELALPRLADVGSIAVLAEPPGADIELDRVPRGRTPAVLMNVPAGTHRVTVSAAGFRPLHSTVTVAPNQQFVLKGKLVPVLSSEAASVDGIEPEKLGVLEPEDIPSTADMAEESAFEPVRKLLAERRYEEALSKLDEMASDERTRAFASRIGQERRTTGRIRDIVGAAYEKLRESEGQHYVLSLRKGIRLEGTLVEVAESQAVMQMAGTERLIPLSSIGAEQIVRLASYRYDPREAVNRTGFSMLYAAEGEFDRAYAELRAALETGYDITAARSYVDSEHLWSAAVEKERTELLRARLAGPPAPQRVTESARPVRVLLDTYRGVELPEQLTGMLAQNSIGLQPFSEPLRPEDLQQPTVLLVRDGGESRPVPAYDGQELQAIVDCMQRGGGLLFIGAHRSVQRQGAGPGQAVVPHPFQPLLRWFGIVVNPDELVVSKEAPEAYPKEYAICAPLTLNPVTNGVRRAVLPMPSPSLAMQDPAWALLGASPYLGSEWSKTVGPPVAAARVFGKGRVLVFSNMPVLDKSVWEGSPVYANDADRMLLNGVLWLWESVASSADAGR